MTSTLIRAAVSPAAFNASQAVQDATEASNQAALAATNGASLVGFDPTLNYAAATLGAVVHDGLVNAMWFLVATERTQVLANGTAIDLTPKINAAKTWAGNRPIYLPAGTWSITTLSGVGWLGGIVGDGIGNTVIKVRSAVTTAIDFGEIVDVNPSAFVLKGFTLDGGTFATNGINVRFRHQYLMESLYIINCVNGIVEKDTYLSRHHNVRARSCSIGWTLVGSNHSSTFVGCTIDGCSVTHLLVQTNGTALDGNSALAFVGCDIEFGTGTAVGADITCSDISFTGCYLGENMPGNVLIMRGGLCTINGGALFFGQTINSYGVNPVGGKVVVRGTQLNGQTNGSVDYLVGTGTGGKVAFYDAPANMLVSGNPVLAGDVLDYGPQGNVFANRLGKSFQGNVNATTISNVVTGNSRKITCLTAPGPNPLITQSVALVNPTQWRDGESMYLVIVYEASKPLTAQISGTPLGGAPTAAIGTLPATTGAAATYVKLDFAAVAGGSFGVLDLLMSAAAVNDYITIYECFFSDSRMLNKGIAQFGNLYKC